MQTSDTSAIVSPDVLALPTSPKALTRLELAIRLLTLYREALIEGQDIPYRECQVLTDVLMAVVADTNTNDF